MKRWPGMSRSYSLQEAYIVDFELIFRVFYAGRREIEFIPPDVPRFFTIEEAQTYLDAMTEEQKNEYAKKLVLADMKNRMQ